jgi:small-conductance mechanosensitive channel
VARAGALTIAHSVTERCTLRWMGSRAQAKLRALTAALLVLGLETNSAHAQQAAFNEDLTTPRRALAVFVEGSGRNDWDRALQVLDVSPQASAERRKRAEPLARQLEYVLSRRLALDLDRFSDQVAGDPADGADTEQVATLPINGRNFSVLLTRLENPTRWVFSRGTLARVPELYAELGPGPLETRMPASLRVEWLALARWQWLGLTGALVAAWIAGRVGIVLSRVLVKRLTSRSQSLWDEHLVRALHAPGQLLIGLIALVPLARLLALPASVWEALASALKVLGIVALSWMAIRTVNLVSRTVELRALSRELQSGHSGSSVRGVQTRVRILRRVISWLLLVCGGALLLMQLEAVRSVGISLLASAGVAGIVLGLAAQRTLGSLLAGIQLSISQPIRIGDDVLVEGEVGAIEEITLTYVVVRLWDERRLIVPITRFLEQPFQNWTKVSSDLHGTVMLYANFTLPISELRREVDRQLARSKTWDGRTKAVHVTDLREHVLEARVLVSARNAGLLFELRAELREALISWLSTFEAGQHLPCWTIVEKPQDTA